MAFRRLLIVVATLGFVSADVYLHIPRGSNNRANEQSANRQNANRMFDSQNNNRGGYNIGDRTENAAGNNDINQYQMEYFMSSANGKSYLDIEWTNQHGCGGSEPDDPHKQNCNMVMQYMCQLSGIAQQNKMRPGVNTAQQDHTALNANQLNNPDNSTTTRRKAGSVKSQRGMDEPWEWYDKCQIRERNKGLFTADQKLKNNNGQGTSSAIYTRQNPNGNRYGYECPEERDYYPYWHPTPWIDIAVLTDNTTWCQYYEQNSFNTQPYGECVERYGNNQNGRVRHFSKHNNPESCAENGGEWVNFYNFIEKDETVQNQAQCEAKSTGTLKYIWAVPFDRYDERGVVTEQCLIQPRKVDCLQAPWSRSNHLGNGVNGTANTYRWELPYFPSDADMRCSFRLRYNISTDDYAPWETDASSNKDLAAGVISPVQQNPYVDIGADITPLRLAINTAQFGRVFQDRSHTFILKPRPNATQSETIYNVNVRGKRGNIVQVYPAVEYDFAPTTLEMNEGDLVHFQWTGSNTHNNGNPGGDGQTGDAGEGRGGTDRSNVAQLADLGDNYPMPYEQTTLWKKANIVWSPIQGLTMSAEDLAVNMASSGYYRCMNAATCDTQSVQTKNQINNLLDNAPASYKGPLMRVQKGTYHYTCTRNNNFSNRSQKGTLIVN